MKTLICVAVLAMACAISSFGQDGRSKPLQAHAKGPVHKVTVAPPLPPAPLVFLFNSFGPTLANLYSTLNGYFILGPASPSFLISQSIGQYFSGFNAPPFTIKKLALPVQYYNIGDGADNKFQVSIYSDAGGVPGALLSGPFGPFATTANFPACCLYTIVNVVPNLAIAAGTPYWVVVDGAGAAGSTEAVWNFSNALPAANVGGGGWFNTGIGTEALVVAGN